MFFCPGLEALGPQDWNHIHSNDLIPIYLQLCFRFGGVRCWQTTPTAVALSQARSMHRHLEGFRVFVVNSLNLSTWNARIPARGFAWLHIRRARKQEKRECDHRLSWQCPTAPALMLSNRRIKACTQNAELCHACRGPGHVVQLQKCPVVSDIH